MKAKPPLAPFVAERDQALLSLDEAQIVRYCEKWGVEMPAAVGSEVWWAGIHKARLMVNAVPPKEKAVSRQWLKSHGFGVPPEER